MHNVKCMIDKGLVEDLQIIVEERGMKLRGCYSVSIDVFTAILQDGLERMKFDVKYRNSILNPIVHKTGIGTIK